MVIRSRSIRWARRVACMGELLNAYSILVEKAEGKRPLGRPGHRCKNHITRKMSLWKRIWKVVDMFHLVQDTAQWRVLLNTVMNFRVP